MRADTSRLCHRWAGYIRRPFRSVDPASMCGRRGRSDDIDLLSALEDNLCRRAMEIAFLRE